VSAPEAIAARRAAAAAPRVATAADLGRVADVLAAAFAEDPVLGWILRTDERRDAVRRELFETVVGQMSPGGEVYLAPDGSAAAACLPPALAGAKTGLVEQLRLLPKMLKLSGIGRIGRLVTLMGTMERNHPHAPPHFYVYFLGVDPAYRGEGLGSILLEAILARWDAKGTPTYLENSNPVNERFYLRHGFRSRGVFRPAPEGPPLDPMWRAVGGA
jgi:GNAT superfamily N-acetyltransferase